MTIYGRTDGRLAPGIDPTDITAPIVQATTLTTNALIEDKTGRAGLVTTQGFGDTLLIRDEHRYDIYDLQIEFPVPPIPRSLTFELDERTSAQAEVLVDPTDADIDALVTQFREADLEGFGGSVLMMLSNGGVVSADDAARRPIRLVESGPAAGALAGTWFAKRLGEERLPCFDMGGTTAKCCRVDQFGLLKVGPESAGAVPGPASYGQSGRIPAVTDADVLLGLLDPAAFLGGDMPLDKSLAEGTTQFVADTLGLSMVDTAAGIHEVVNQNMAAAARMHGVEMGVDLRGVTLIAFGGAGLVQACGVADLLESDRVIFSVNAGALSAFGTLVSPVRIELARSLPRISTQVDDAERDALLDELLDEGRRVLLAAGAPSDEVEYQRIYGMSIPEAAVEAVTWRLSAVATTSLVEPDSSFAGDGGPATRIGSRPMVFNRGPMSVTEVQLVPAWREGRIIALFGSTIQHTDGEAVETQARITLAGSDVVRLELPGGSGHGEAA